MISSNSSVFRIDVFPSLVTSKEYRHTVSFWCLYWLILSCLALMHLLTMLVDHMFSSGEYLLVFRSISYLLMLILSPYISNLSRGATCCFSRSSRDSSFWTTCFSPRYASKVREERLTVARELVVCWLRALFANGANADAPALQASPVPLSPICSCCRISDSK